jgi:Sugar-transfer associated ATP-grasp
MRASAQRIRSDEPAENHAVDVTRPSKDRPLAEALLKAISSSGVSATRVLQDYARLAFGPGRLSFNDYMRLRLFDDKLYANTNKKSFIGARANRDIAVAVNYRHDWFGLLANKIASVAYLRTFGLPTIPFVAVYANNLGRPAENLLRSPNELRAFLKDPAHYPLFGKPTEGYQSLGSAALAAYDPSSEEITFVGGRRLAADYFASYIGNHYPRGYLFQPLLLPHADVRRLCGDRLPTLRVLTIDTQSGPKVARAAWKIPAGGNAADNYWRAGNILAQLDPSNGRILRAFSGSGVDLSEPTTHPDSGIDLLGFQFPNWADTLELALQGARLMHHVPMIGWDIAPTPARATIVEMNETPDCFLHQLADGQGMLNEEFTDFIAFQKRNAARRIKDVRAALEKL